MSFRARLGLFFAIIVIVPMIATGAALFSLIRGSEEGKADARIATSLDVALSLYSDGRASAGRALDRVGADPQLNAALVRADRRGAVRRLGELVRADRRIVSANLRTPGDRVVAIGPAAGVAPAAAVIRRPDRRSLARLGVSVTDGRRLAEQAHRRTGASFVIVRDGRPAAASRGAPRTVPSRSGNFSSGGVDYRARRQSVARVDGTQVELVAAVRRGSSEDRAGKSRLLIGAILLAFLLLALASSLFVTRALQAQIGQLLAGARRLAGGDFRHPVPTTGNDEFAQLGREFNSMADELRAQVEEVERRRRQTEETIRRVGAAFASGLDSQAVLELTVHTAVDACGAEAGFGLPLDQEFFDEVAVGAGAEGHEAAARAAERAAVAARPETGNELFEVPVDGAVQQGSSHSAELDGVHALAQPLWARLGTRTSARFIGVISIARQSGPFSQEEVELLEYLAGQAVVSVENAALHLTVQQQALTDELTGLANVRDMQGALHREFERGKRFDTPVGFVLLDIDDFKQVNDTYGHLQGDRVLVEVGRVLREMSRDIDEPARYGGEELAVVLPQTDIDGAVRLAERVREAVADLRVARVDGDGHVAITASFGVASVPSSASDQESLVAAADAALYEAKRAGKNRVKRAGSSLAPTD
ncbi:MAG: diguanylate cyclase [Thermoleophilaceae bacterium]